MDHLREATPVTSDADGVRVLEGTQETAGQIGAAAAQDASQVFSGLGFSPLLDAFFVTLGVMVVGYLAHIEIAKTWFYEATREPVPSDVLVPVAPAAPRHRLLQRRARRFSIIGDLRRPRRPAARGAP